MRILIGPVIPPAPSLPRNYSFSEQMPVFAKGLSSTTFKFLLLDEHYIYGMINGFLDYQVGFLTLSPVAFQFSNHQSLLSKESRFGISLTVTSSVVKTDAQQSVISNVIIFLNCSLLPWNIHWIKQ